MLKLITVPSLQIRHIKFSERVTTHGSVVYLMTKSRTSVQRNTTTSFTPKKMPCSIA